MKILCLYNNTCAVKLFKWLEKEGHECVQWDKKLDPEWCEQEQFDLTVSYTYSYIIKRDVLNALGNNVVNLHNSFLPWNRGGNPNMWSLIDDTPRGVTLHYIDCDLDKGLIIAQELDSDLNALETLKTTYDRLDFLAVEMFKKAFRYYRFWPQMQKQALGKGTYHTDKQGELLRKCIDDYDIKCDEFIRRYKEIVNVEK